MTERIGVIGLGYVGFPIALALVRRVPHTVGFDINPTHVAPRIEGFDGTSEVCTGPVLRASATVGAALRHDSGYASIAYKVGYSPQRINPGDGEHSFETIVNEKAAVNTKQARANVQYWSW